MYAKIQELCKKNKTSISKLEVDLGFSRGSIFKWDAHNPSFDKVQMVAEYFNVSIEYFSDKERWKDEQITDF